MTKWICADCVGAPACEFDDNDVTGLIPKSCPIEGRYETIHGEKFWVGKKCNWEYLAGPVAECDTPKTSYRALGGVR